MNSKRTKARKVQLICEYGLRCWWCLDSFSPKELTLDHLKPKSRGGSNSLENLRLACFPCNNSRGNSLYPPRRLSAHTSVFSQLVRE